MIEPKAKSIGIFLLIIFWAGHSYSQSTTNFKDYVIKYERIEFRLDDSVKKVTLFVEPNGYFYFNEGFVESSHPDMVSIRRINDKAKEFDYRDTFVLKSNKVSQISNLFPLLYKNDSSILNHFPHVYRPTNYFYNLEYSFILNNLDEKKLYGLEDKEIIRIIEPEETSGVSRDYSAMILDLEQKKFYYRKGKFDLNIDYKIIKNDSIIISDKQLGKIKTIVDQVDFKSVKYFTEVGVNVNPKYLIEYLNSEDYFVFEKQIISPNKQDRKFNELLIMFWSIKAKMKK